MPVSRDACIARLRAKAIRLIESESYVAFDACARVGQIFDNVKHMDWLVEAVMDEIDETWRD